MRISRVVCSIYVLRSDRRGEAARAFNHQLVVKHLDEDVHVFQTIGAVNARIDQCLKPCGPRVFGSVKESSVSSEPGKIPELRFDHPSRLLDQSRNRPFNWGVAHNVILLPGKLDLPFDAQEPDLATRKWPRRAFGK